MYYFFFMIQLKSELVLLLDGSSTDELLQLCSRCNTELWTVLVKRGVLHDEQKHLETKGALRRWVCCRTTETNFILWACV